MIRQWVQENVFNIMNDVDQMVYAKKYILEHPNENAAQLLIDVANKYPNCISVGYNQIMNYPELNTRPLDVANAWDEIAVSQCQNEEQAVAMVQMIVDNVSKKFPIWKFFSTGDYFLAPSYFVTEWPMVWFKFEQIRPRDDPRKKMYRTSLLEDKTEEEKIRLQAVEQRIL